MLRALLGNGRGSFSIRRTRYLALLAVFAPVAAIGMGRLGEPEDVPHVPLHIPASYAASSLPSLALTPPGLSSPEASRVGVWQEAQVFAPFEIDIPPSTFESSALLAATEIQPPDAGGEEPIEFPPETVEPTSTPTSTPTVAPTAAPAAAPTQAPTPIPTPAATATPVPSPTAIPQPTATPALVATVAPTPVATATPAPIATGGRYVSEAELLAALARSSWPESTWQQLIRVAYCESGVDLDRDGTRDHFDTQARGDGGSTHGIMQIYTVAHPGLAAQYNLLSLEGNLAAAYVIWNDAGGSFSPWTCARY